MRKETPDEAYRPDFLVVGHITLDVVAEGFMPGGTAFYAAIAAAQLGRRVAVLTRGAPRQAKQVLSGLVRMVDLPSNNTTTFENRYVNGLRTQRILSLAQPIQISDIPDQWKKCPVVLLAPVADEVDSSMASIFSSSILGLSPQGWMRRVEGPEAVRSKPWVEDQVIEKAHVVAVSEFDLPKRRLPRAWLRRHTGILILTHGSRDSMAHWNGQWFRIPIFPANEEDPTGAGDVFIATYLVRYSETRDHLAACLYASCAASLKVEAKGATGIPTRDAIESRVDAHRELKVVTL